MVGCLFTPKALYSKAQRVSAASEQPRRWQVMFGVEAAATLLVAAAIKPLVQDWYLKRWKYRRRKIAVEAYADFVIAMIDAYGSGKQEGRKDDLS